MIIHALRDRVREVCGSHPCAGARHEAAHVQMSARPTDGGAHGWLVDVQRVSK